MEQFITMRGVASTLLAIELSLAAVPMTDTIQVRGDEFLKTNYSALTHAFTFQNNSTMFDYNTHIYTVRKMSRLEAIATEWFGQMRDATDEELDGVEEYIKSISKETGANFFDIC